MGFNLTNEQIQNTYQQLVQVSGSTLLDGTGSAIAFSVPTASYAITASYALNGGGGGTVDTGSLMVTASAALNVVTFTKGDGSTFAVTIETGSADVTGKLDTSVFVAYTASNDLAVAAKLATSTFTSYSSSMSTRLTNDESSISSLNSATSSYAVKTAVSGAFTSLSSSLSTRLTNDEASINALNAATSSYLTSLPSGVVSSSAQISYTGITNVPAGIVSSSAQVVSSLSGQSISVLDVTASGGFKGDGSGLTNVGVSATASFTNQSTWNFVHGLGKDLLNIQTYNTNYEQIIPTNIDLVSSTQATITFPFNVSGYAVATLGGGTSTGAGTSVVKSANMFYDARTFLIDAPGTFASTPIDVHISQSGLYVISASQQPPYGANGPRVNLYWYPDSIGYGETSKVKFWIPSKDTGGGITYKNNVSSSFTGNNYWGWPASTKPDAANSASISRPGLASAFSLATGTLVNTMVRDGDGFVYFNLGTTDPSAQYYFFSGSSTAPMV